MKILDKAYKKLKPSQKRDYKVALSKLEQRFKTYADQNINIGQVFNDDTLTHDIIHKYFYVYKCKVRNLQMRVLYTVNDKGEIVVLSHHRKEQDTTDYLEDFEKVTTAYMS